MALFNTSIIEKTHLRPFALPLVGIQDFHRQHSTGVVAQDHRIVIGKILLSSYDSKNRIWRTVFVEMAYENLCSV